MADTADLNADVRAFAAQLGLGGGGGDDSFSDFDPKKSKKRIGVAPKPGKPARAKEDAGVSPPLPHKAPAGGAQASPKVLHKPQELTHKPRASKPNDVGSTRSADQQSRPAPQAKQQGIMGRSILPRDEPALWWEAAARHTARLPAATAEADPSVIPARKVAAEALLEAEETVAAAALGRRHGTDAQWLQQVRRSGTTSDRVAAASVLVQDQALTQLAALDTLLGMAAKRGGARAVVGATLDALTELFGGVLLPDRRLRFFEQQALDALRLGQRADDLALLYLHFEDCVKKRYARFVEILEGGSKDNLEFVKDKSVRAMYDLLSKKPEQEQRLLSALVNKLGDPDRKLASKVGFLLSKLLTEHPMMKVVVVREVERFMFRPGLQDRARYYAVIYLNQMVLSHTGDQGGPMLARRLIDVYFTLFAMILDGKIGTAATLKDASVVAKTSKKGKDGKHQKRKGGKGSKHGRGGKHVHKHTPKGKQGREGEAGAAPEALTAQSGELDARMLSALLTGVRRAFPFVPQEEVEPLIQQHADALFRLIHTRSFGVATQALLLLFQLMSSRNALSDRFYRALYSVLSNSEITKSSKAPMFLSLLLKAVHADVSHKRTAAFAKRLLQVAMEAPPNFACGCLILVSELLKARPGLWNSILQSEEGARDGLEHFKDAEEEKEGAQGGEIGEPAPSKPARVKDKGRGERWPDTEDSYDPQKRDPQHANADASCLWELDSLAVHVHPSVAAMAKALLAGTSVVYGGDPLRDLTPAAFLDKFIARKPKSSGRSRGASAMQPLPGVAGEGALDFARLSEADVAPEDVFFLKYYNLQSVQSKRAVTKAKKPKGKEDHDLLSDADSDDADEYLEEQEEGGDEGIGADPDRSGKYDYNQLVSAMQDSDDDEDGASDGEARSSEGGSGAESGEELEGAAFSDMSSDDEGPGGGASTSGSDEEDEGEEGVGSDEDDLASLPSSGSEQSSDEDAAADAEVATLLKLHAVKRGAGRAPVGGEDINPFELAEPSSSSGEDEEEEQEEGEEAAIPTQRKRRSKDLADDFAPMEEYEHLLGGLGGASDGAGSAGKGRPEKRKRR